MRLKELKYDTLKIFRLIFVVPDFAGGKKEKKLKRTQIQTFFKWWERKQIVEKCKENFSKLLFVKLRQFQQQRNNASVDSMRKKFEKKSVLVSI